MTLPIPLTLVPGEQLNFCFSAPLLSKLQRLVLFAELALRGILEARSPRILQQHTPSTSSHQSSPTAADNPGFHEEAPKSSHGRRNNLAVLCAIGPYQSFPEGHRDFRQRRRRLGCGAAESGRIMTTSISPQTVEPRSDKLVATPESPNTAPTSAQNKRARSLIDSGLGFGDEKSEADIREEGLEIIRKFTESLNKRLKHSHVELQIAVHNTPSSGPIRANGNIQSANDSHAGGDSRQSTDQAIQAHQEHQAPRLSLSSTLSSSRSNVGNQIPKIFSPQEQPLDSQSVYSQATAQSTYSSYPPGGKACLTCIKHLSGSYVSSWKNHFWPTHCPQLGYYCLFCKVDLVEENGTVFWRCKNCPTKFSDEKVAVEHFTDRSLPCYKDKALWVRDKPWKDHLQQENIINRPDNKKQCLLCYKLFPDEAQSKKHKCPRTSDWKYQMSTPLPTSCEDHPGTVFETCEQVNEHYENEHLRRSKPSSAGTRRRNRWPGARTVAGSDSRRDNYSMIGNDPPTHGQQDSASDLASSGAIKDPITDWTGLSQEPKPQNPHYSRDLLLGDERRTLSNRSLRPRTLAPRRELCPEPDELPVLSNIVTEDGDPRFYFR